MRTLLEINNAVVSCLDSQTLFQTIAASLRRTFGLDYASLLIYDPEVRALRFQMLDFPEGIGAIREDALVPIDGSLAGQVFQTRRAGRFDRAKCAPRPPRRWPARSPLGVLRAADLPWPGPGNPQRGLARGGLFHPR